MGNDGAVLGCGLMGSAVARVLADGPGVTRVWNRSPAKAEQLASAGAQPVATAAEAIGSSGLVIGLLSDYDALRAVVDAAGPWPATTTLVNLITGSPSDAREAAAWAARQGIPYLDGAIIAYPTDIGGVSTRIVYAGDPALWLRNEQTLLGLGGGSVHVGEKVDAANIYDVAVAGAFNVALGGFVEAAAFAESAGLGVRALQSGAEVLIELLRREIDVATDEIEAGRYETDQATIEVYAHATRSWLNSMTAAGNRASLLRAALENLDTALAAGNGGKAFSGQVLSSRLGP